MFTARAEYRLKLRHDTADERLTERAYAIGLQRPEAVERLRTKVGKKEALAVLLKEHRVRTTDGVAYPSLEKHVGKSCAEALQDPHVPLTDILALDSAFLEFPAEIQTAAELDIRYSHYIEAQDKRIEKLKKMDGTRIPANFNYDAVSGLSVDSRAKLKAVQPATLAQAARISGLRTSDVMLLMVFLR